MKDEEDECREMRRQDVEEAAGGGRRGILGTGIEGRGDPGENGMGKKVDYQLMNGRE